MASPVIYWIPLEIGDQALQQSAPGLPICSAVVTAAPNPANLNPK